MGRKPVKNKKIPSDYPQISFRVSKEDKEVVLNEISKIQNKLNTKRKINEPFINKNDVFVMAIKSGLRKLKWYKSDGWMDYDIKRTKAQNSKNKLEKEKEIIKKLLIKSIHDNNYFLNEKRKTIAISALAEDETIKFFYNTAKKYEIKIGQFEDSVAVNNFLTILFDFVFFTYFRNIQFEQNNPHIKIKFDNKKFVKKITQKTQKIISEIQKYPYLTQIEERCNGFNVSVSSLYNILIAFENFQPRTLKLSTTMSDSKQIEKVRNLNSFRNSFILDLSKFLEKVLGSSSVTSSK